MVQWGMEQDTSPHGEWAADDYGGRNIKPNPYGVAARTANWEPKAATITTANPKKTFHVDWEPEYWHVVVLTAAGLFVAVYTGSDSGGPSLILGGGGRVKQMPAAMNSGDLTVVLLSGASATVIAIAIYGLKDFDYIPGVLA